MVENKGSRLIDSILHKRDESATQVSASQKKKGNDLNAEFNRLIIPLEKTLIQENLPVELCDLLDDFARKAGEKLKTSFAKNRWVDWSEKKEEVLKKFHRGSLKEADAKIRISFVAPVVDFNTNQVYLHQGIETKYYRFGMSISSDGQGEVHLANNYSWGFDGTQKSLVVIANGFADFLDMRKLQLGRNDPETPEMRLVRKLSSALIYSEREQKDY